MSPLPRVRAQGDTDIDADVEGAIRRLGITQCADTRVGGEKEGTAVAGCSGGERRRLAIGEETVGRAGGTALAALLADEPTTGLDSFQADKARRDGGSGDGPRWQRKSISIALQAPFFAGIATHARGPSRLHF